MAKKSESVALSAKVFVPETLVNLAERTRRGGATESEPTRTLLRWFGYERRTPYAVALIRRALDAVQIVTIPDFESAYIDSPIGFFKATTPRSADPGGNGFTSARSDRSDPTYKIGRLEAANRGVVHVKPDDETSDAITLMLARSFSQMPVMTSERSVKGVITWGSIGSRYALGRGTKFVRDCYDLAPPIMSADTSLFDAIAPISDRGFVLVQDATNRISGIITASDIAVIFRELGEPFLVLSEIENQIRQLIQSKYSVEELKKIVREVDANRVVEGVDDLTFGDYVHLLAEPKRWSELQLSVSRSVFIKNIDAVRLIRNNVMHFDPDGLTADELETLRSFKRFMQNLKECGAI